MVVYYQTGGILLIQELIDGRRLPPLRSREEMLEILAREEYGIMPKAPVSVTVDEIDVGRNRSQCAGHAEYREYCLHAQMDEYTVSFPIRCVFPTQVPEEGLPAFVFINFRKEVPDWYFPAQEIAEAGFAVASVCYNDITADSEDDFTSGIAPMILSHEGKTSKISLWAWACSRVCDYLLSLPTIDKKRIAVIGHSRLGKTALWAGANDDRFAFVCANDSGCSGAALSRGKEGETIEAITRVFPRWFSSTEYAQYAGNEDSAPFDQHYLLACIAPRTLCVGCAIEDSWADPLSEYLSCCAASDAWQAQGQPGFVHPDRKPMVGDVFAEGGITYHLREGGHYLDLFDWRTYMACMQK